MELNTIQASNVLCAGGVVLISGGVGLTPMVSMLETLLADGADHRPVAYIQCAKNEAAHPMKEHVDKICDKKKAAGKKKISSHVFYSKPEHKSWSFTKPLRTVMN